MDSSTVTTVAAIVAAVAALIAAAVSLFSWRLQQANYAENKGDKERLRLEERYFKLHLLSQDLRVAGIILHGLPLALPDYTVHLEGLPIVQLTEALATKDLLTGEVALRIRVARDDLVQLEQLANDSRNPDTRRRLAFEQKFPEQVSKTFASVQQARQMLLEHLPD